MTDVRSIPISLLLLDERNPRLHHQFGDQRAILEAMLQDRELGPKILSLAEDISIFGLNPADLLIVTPEDAPDGQFTVVEGNRRLAALSLLMKPALAAEILPAATVTRIRACIAKMKTPITSVPVVVVPTRSEADHWIEVRHGGELGGVGILRWDAKATDRWRSRDAEAPSFISQVLSFLQKMGVMPDWYAATPGRFPITTLDRMLIGAEGRARFGLALDEDKFLVLLHQPEKVAAALAPIVQDLATGRKTVSDLKRKEQREGYIADRVTLPAAASRLPAPLPAESVPAPMPANPKQAAGASPKRSKGQKPSRKQIALIARSAALNVTQQRINDIYDELQRLPVDDYPNCAGVMLRVFLELSIDDFIRRQRPMLMTKEAMSDPKKGSLANKIVTVANFMQAQHIMTKKELTSARSLAQSGNLFVPKVTLMNGFVHNSSVTPKATELKSEWNDLLEFFRKIWAN